MRSPAHLMVNLSWRCNQNPPCPYCWVHQLIDDRRGLKDHSWEEWAEVLMELDDCTLDFVGGEPLIFPGFYDLLKIVAEKHLWAVTSNVVSLKMVERLSQSLITNCRGFTCSWHPYGLLSRAEFACRAMMLKTAGYPVDVNVVMTDDTQLEADAVALESVGLRVFRSPYEDPVDVTRQHDKVFTCEGGIAHAVLDPQGNAYRCLTLFRHPGRDRFVLGNVFEGMEWPQKVAVCNVWCEQFYVLGAKHPTSDMFNLRVHEVTFENLAGERL